MVLHGQCLGQCLCKGGREEKGGKGEYSGSVRTLPIHEGTVVATCMSCTHTCISNTFIIYLNICTPVPDIFKIVNQ